MAAEAADGAFLDRDERLVGAGEPQDQVAVERLGEAGVGDGGVDALRGQRVGGLFDLLQAGAEGEERHALAFADHPARPISSGVPRSGSSTPTPSPRG
jgi:hypothetical protein